MKLGIKGTEGKETVAHAVVASAYYVETVTYQQKNIWGNWKTYTKDFKVVRVCDGWQDSSSTSWNSTTNKFMFFDCVTNLLKFK